MSFRWGLGDDGLVAMVFYMLFIRLRQWLTGLTDKTQMNLNRHFTTTPKIPIQSKKPPSGGVASLLGDRNCGLLDRNQRQVGMSAALVYYRLHGIGNKHQLAVNRDRRA